MAVGRSGDRIPDDGGVGVFDGFLVATGQRENRADAIGGVEAMLFYLLAYGSMTVGVFAVLLYLSTPERSVENVDDLAGLGKSHLVTAIGFCQGEHAIDHACQVGALARDRF